MVTSAQPIIAVIEDDREIRELLDECLREAGYRTVMYSDAREALLELESGETPALIVLDLMMPEMDGWTFRVRQRESSKLGSVPVVVISADRSPQAVAIDADAYLPKPLDLDRLLSGIERLLAAAERHRLLAQSLENERLRKLGMLVSSIAHEVNNPLSYAVGNVELALNDCERLTALYPYPKAKALTSVLKSRLLAVADGTDRVARIVADLLAFARSEKDVTGEARASVAQAIEGALRLVTPLAKSRATLKTELPALPPVVGHESRLAQVFLNLLANAVQAIPDGDPEWNTITISARGEGDEVSVMVADTGSGIAPEHLPRVFDAFFTTKPVGEGTGIGLSFCKEVIEGYGGSITVSSVLGEGTTFTVRLRAAEPASSAPANDQGLSRK
jgi:signal transduction histidine kinase